MERLIIYYKILYIKNCVYTQRKKPYQQLEILGQIASTMYYKVVITTINK